MTLLENLSETHGGLAESVLILEDQLSARYRPSLTLEPPEGVAGRPVARAVEAAFREPSRPRVAEAVLPMSTPPAGIYGGGVVRYDDDLRLALFVMIEVLRAAGFMDRDVIELTESRELAQYLSELGLDLHDPTLVVGLERPQEHVAPGDPVVCLGMRGTCGVAVSTEQGNPAFLTAGHVARPVGTTVDDATGRIGTVVWSDSLADHRPGEVCADAGVVELRADIPVQGGPGIAVSGSASQLAHVVSHGQRGPRSAWLRVPLMPSFALTTNEGAWGDVFLTDQAISIGGDSGAPVLLDETNTLVGLIVAGAGSYSLVQDISYVLRESETTFVPCP
jgi:hypothetical protein